MNLVALLVTLFFGVNARAAAPSPRPVSAKVSAGAPSVGDDMDDDDDDDDEEEEEGDEVESSIGTKTIASEKSKSSRKLVIEPIQGNIMITTDYILRGLSQTDHQPALQGGFEWSLPAQFDLSLWGSNVHFVGSTASLELDWSGGYTAQFSDLVSLRGGLTYLSYFEDYTRNSWEMPFKLEVGSFTGEMIYSPRWAGKDPHAWYFSAGWSDEVWQEFELGFALGYSVFPESARAQNYVDFKATLSREFFDVDFGLTGIIVNQQVINQAEGGSTLVFSASKSF